MTNAVCFHSVFWGENKTKMVFYPCSGGCFSPVTC